MGAPSQRPEDGDWGPHGMAPRHFRACHAVPATSSQSRDSGLRRPCGRSTCHGGAAADGRHRPRCRVWDGRRAAGLRGVGLAHLFPPAGLLVDRLARARLLPGRSGAMLPVGDLWRPSSPAPWSAGQGAGGWAVAGRCVLPGCRLFGPRAAAPVACRRRAPTCAVPRPVRDRGRRRGRHPSARRAAAPGRAPVRRKDRNRSRPTAAAPGRAPDHRKDRNP